MNRNQSLLMACALGLGLSAKSMAGAITADGNLSDWGLFNGSTTWTPSGNQSGKSYSYNGLTIYYTIEDYTGGGNGQVYPGYGGQAYDAEALYVTWDAANLYIALVTGHDPNTKQNEKNNTYSAGDFALNFWSGSADHTYEFGIRTPNQSNNIGTFSTDLYRTTSPNNWRQSNLWNSQLQPYQRVTSLNTTGLTPLQTKAMMSIQEGPSSIGQGSGPHWVYEVSVSKTIFNDFLKPSIELNISWTMNCANDIIMVEDDIPTIDEPPVWALLGLTLPAAFWRRRRSAKR